MRAVRPALPLLLLTGLLAGCGGSSCDALPDLRAERDAARAAYDVLLRSGTADPAETTQADDDVHVLDRQVYDLEQTC